MSLYLDHLTLWVHNLEETKKHWNDKGFQTSEIKNFGDWSGILLFLKDGFYFEILKFNDEALEKEWVINWRKHLELFNGKYDSIVFASTDIEQDKSKLINFYSSPIKGTQLQNYKKDKQSGWLTYTFEDESNYLENSKTRYGINLGILQYITEGKKWLRTCMHGHEQTWKQTGPETYDLAHHENKVTSLDRVTLKIHPRRTKKWTELLVNGGLTQKNDTFIDYTGKVITLIQDPSAAVTAVDYTFKVSHSTP